VGRMCEGAFQVKKENEGSSVESSRRKLVEAVVIINKQKLDQRGSHILLVIGQVG